MRAELKGVAATQQMMRQVAERLANQGVRKVVRAGAEVIRDAIEERTPVSAGTTAGSSALQPGELKADIGISMRKRGGSITAFIGPGKKTRHVAGWVEYGHRTSKGGSSRLLANGKTRGPGKVGADVPAHPFIRPAYEESVANAVAASQAEAKRQIEEKG